MCGKFAFAHPTQTETSNSNETGPGVSITKNRKMPDEHVGNSSCGFMHIRFRIVYFFYWK